uniref:Putative secreted protein n=1 Tax=Anopheles triannulatus TaxID=58253 RepID=A0A2M4B1K1_9DIPT
MRCVRMLLVASGSLLLTLFLEQSVRRAVSLWLGGEQDFFRFWGEPPRAANAPTVSRKTSSLGCWHLEQGEISRRGLLHKPGLRTERFPWKLLFTPKTHQSLGKHARTKVEGGTSEQRSL